MKARYDDAVAQLTSGAYQRATAQFQAIVRDASSNYRDVTNRLADVAAKQHEAAQRTYAAAQLSEHAQAWDKALEQFQAAHDLDPSLNIANDLARVADAK